jgi:hypothetical protein
MTQSKDDEIVDLKKQVAILCRQNMILADIVRKQIYIHRGWVEELDKIDNVIMTMRSVLLGNLEK